MANPTITPIMTPGRGPNVPDIQPVTLYDVFGNPTNGAVPEIELYTRNGQAFIANGIGTTATNANLLNGALGIFNPVNSTKTLLIYSLRGMTGSNGGTTSKWQLVTSDPAFGTAVTPVRLPGVLTPGSVASCSQTASGNTVTVVAPGTKMEDFLPTSAVTFDILTNGAVIPLPPGNGLAVMIFVGTTGNYFQGTAKWIEV